MENGCSTTTEMELGNEYTVGKSLCDGLGDGGDVDFKLKVWSLCMGCNRERNDVGLLPCLHVACADCIEHEISANKAMSSDKKASFIFACPKCQYKVNFSNTDNIVTILKPVPKFLQYRMPENVQYADIADADNHSNGNMKDVIKLCDECQVNLANGQELIHCSQCNKKLCLPCQGKDHKKHKTLPLSDFIQNKIGYIQNLIGGISKKMINHGEALSCIDRVVSYISSAKEDIKQDIIERSEYLISLINHRKKQLLGDLDIVYTNHIQSYAEFEQKFMKELEQFKFIKNIGQDLVDYGSNEDLMNIHEDVSNQFLHQMHQVPDAAVDVVSFKLDIPGKGKEHSTLEKLFGTLTEGTILSGSAELIASFNVDMKWPTSIAVSTSKEVVVTGKTGAFDAEGKAFFYDSRGRFHSKVNFDSQHLPIDVSPAGDGTMWLSNSSGEIQNMSVAGRILRTVPDVFQGSGHLSVLSDASLVIASTAEREVKVHNDLGQFIRSICIPGFNSDPNLNKDDRGKVKLNCLTTNSNDVIIIGDTDSAKVIGIDTDGTLKFVYESCDVMGLTPALKCPSALCCDLFDNILIADFTNDNIHLLSNAGKFLGCLLDRNNGLSCPNCLALDNEGRLYIGQYGGDILIYRYMSCTKKI